METIDSSHMRIINSNIVLKNIWQKKEISRAELSRLTGMSRSTISAIVSDLILKRLITEEGSRLSKGGRRPVILAFNGDSYSMMGVDLGVSHLSFIHSNLQGQVLATQTLACDVFKQPDEAIHHILRFTKAYKEAGASLRMPLLGMGVGVPFPVHPQQQHALFRSPSLPAWKNHDLREILRKEAALPLFFENDANLGALAELWWSDNDGKNRNLAFIKLGTRVGAGLIIDGKIHRGTRGLTGEIGSVVLNVNPPAGTEATASFGTIQSWIDDVIARGRSAQQIFDEGAFFLGVGLMNLLALLDLDEVVFGGNFNQAGELLVSKLQDVVRTHGLQDREVVLSWSQKGETQIALGAATMVLEKLLDDITLVPEQHEPA